MHLRIKNTIKINHIDCEKVCNLDLIKFLQFFPRIATKFLNLYQHVEANHS